MLKKLFSFFFTLLFLYHSALALADADILPQPFIGVFEKESALRIKPEYNTERLTKVPAKTRLYLTPVNSEYAQTTYNGITGYVFYPSALHDDAMDHAVTPFVAYVEKGSFSYPAPHYSANPCTLLVAHAPLTIIAENGDFLKLDTNQYVLSSVVKPLEDDISIPQTEAYLKITDALVRLPLHGADILSVIPIGEKVTIVAVNNDYSLVIYNGISGYVFSSSLSQAQNTKDDYMLCRVNRASILYDSPSHFAYSSAFLSPNTYIEVDKVTDDFSHISGSDQYVLSDTLTIFPVQSIKPFLGYFSDNQPLFDLADGVASPLDCILPKNSLIEVRYAYGNYYAMTDGQQWGFVPKKNLQTLNTISFRSATANLVKKGTPMHTSPFLDSPVKSVASTDIPLWVSETINGFIPYEMDGTTVYFDADAPETIGKVEKVRAYEGYLNNKTPLRAFPSEVSTDVLLTLPANTLLDITSEVGSFARITYENQTGYVSKTALQPMSNLFSSEDIPNYYLFLNKASKKLTVYLADADGKKTNTIVRETVVAIGRRTTPTPSGIFKLGKRERWHYFGPSYSPFAIEFRSNRYLHGPLYYAADETRINNARLSDFGKQATGGCIRMPYDDILWIYTHCMSQNAMLEIVNDELVLTGE